MTSLQIIHVQYFERIIWRESDLTQYIESNKSIHVHH